MVQLLFFSSIHHQETQTSLCVIPSRGIAFQSRRPQRGNLIPSYPLRKPNVWYSKVGLLLIAPRAKATLPFLSTSSNAAFKINKPSLPSLFLPAPGRGKHLPSDSPRIFLPPCRARAQRRQNLRPSLLIIGARAFGLNTTNAEITLHCYRYVYKHPQYCLIVRPSNDVSSALGSKIQCSLFIIIV